MEISEKIKVAVASLAMVAMGVVSLCAPVAACDVSDDCTGCSPNTTEATECYAKLAGQGSGKTDGLFTTLQGILNAVFGVIGFLAVVMLVYGGIQYTISSGDAGKVKKAKDTILYGIVGLVIALIAAAIVNFVLVNL